MSSYVTTLVKLYGEEQARSLLGKLVYYNGKRDDIPRDFPFEVTWAQGDQVEISSEHFNNGVAAIVFACDLEPVAAQEVA